MDSTHARDNEDLQLHLLKSFHGNGAPWSLYTRAGRFPLGDPPPMQSNKTNYWEVRRRVSLLVPGIALWAPEPFGNSRARFRLHFAGAEAKMRVEEAQKYWQYGRSPYQMRTN